MEEQTLLIEQFIEMTLRTLKDATGDRRAAAELAWRLLQEAVASSDKAGRTSG